MRSRAVKNFPIPPRILLVDDDISFRREFKECFEEYGMIDAANAAEALAILKRPHEIDLAILDVRMSGMNGLELLERVKEAAPDVRVVILTGYGSKDIVVEALRSRADDYIEKPLDIEATRQVIEKHLEKKKRAQYGPGIEDKMARVKDFLLRNFHKKVTLRDAASAVFLSPKYLSRIFKEHTKKGFNEYKLALKVEQARNFLTKTSYTVAQISDKLGYQNPESFIRQFKSHTRLTPTAYRRRNTKKKKRTRP